MSRSGKSINKKIGSTISLQHINDTRKLSTGDIYTCEPFRPADYIVQKSLQGEKIYIPHNMPKDDAAIRPFRQQTSMARQIIKATHKELGNKHIVLRNIDTKLYTSYEQTHQRQNLLLRV
jgi:hypothetical protein